MYNNDPSIAANNVKTAGVQYELNPGAEHGDHIKNTTAICNTAASHTYGNVISVVEKYLLDEIFPKGLFEQGSIVVSTSLASRQIRHLPRQMLKKEFPIMVLIPRISFGQGDDRFLANTLMNSRITNTHSFWGNGQLLPLAEDPRKRLYVHGHYNRAVMYIDVIVAFNTYSEQINYNSLLWNMGIINRYQSIAAPLELYIPEHFCNLMSNLINIPISNENSVYDFLTYMNSIWHYPITYKLNGGSNTNDFFMYYITDIDMMINEPTVGSGIKDEQVKRSYDISFTIRCDFNTIGYFTLNHPSIEKQIHVPNTSSSMDKAIIPIFSDNIDLNDYKLPLGWKILSWPIFKLSLGTNSISIDNVLNQSLRAVIDHHLKIGLPMEKFIRIQFRENGIAITNELFYIDWKDRKIVLLDPDYHKTYRLIIMVSIDYINNLIKELYNLE